MVKTPFSKEFLARFEVQRLLGEGGVASVYLADQRDLDRTCAIKAFRPGSFTTQEARDRFLDEGRLLAKIRHPNIVEVFDSGVDGAVLYLVLEYVSGRDLKERIRERADARKSGALSVKKSLRLAAEVAEGLAIAHEQGIVHRDLKPENILVTRDGVPKVADFGFAKFDAETLQRSYSTKEGVILGTPYYIAPEVVTTQTITDKADIYALGIILFECLTGKPPFHGGNDTSILLRHTSEPVPDVSELIPEAPAQVNDLIQWCCHKEPDKRPKSATSLAKVLREALYALPKWSSEIAIPRRSSAVMSGVAPRVGTRITPTPNRAWPRNLALAAGFTGLAVVSFWIFGKGTPPPQQLVATPTFTGFLVRWKSPLGSPGRIAYRTAGEGTWQEIPGSSPQGEDHAILVGDLGPGKYDVRVVHGDDETPCPPVTVRRYKRQSPLITAAPDGEGFRVRCRTNVPVQLAVTDGDEPRPEAWSPLREEHDLVVALRPTQRWSHPLIYSRDGSGAIRMEPLSRPLAGWRRAANDLVGDLARHKIDLEEVASQLEERVEALLDSEQAEIRVVETKLADQAFEENPSRTHHQAVNAHLGTLREPFEAILAIHPLLQRTADFARDADRFFTAKDVPVDEKIAVYQALNSLVPVDGLAQAYGAPGPLRLTQTMQRLVPQKIVGSKQAATRLATLRAAASAGGAVEVFHLETLEENTFVIPQYFEIPKFAREMISGASSKFYEFDPEKAHVSMTAEAILPPASDGRPKEIAFHVFNLNPFLCALVRFTPRSGGPPVEVIFQNSASIFPGIETMAHRTKTKNDQLFTATLQPWMLPPGSYEVQVTSRHMPGRSKALSWSLQDLFVAW